MRVAHASGTDDAPATLKRRMAELATTYPGALREIDELEIAEIRGRIAAIDAVLEARGEAEPWMKAMGLFHALARGALAAKRWLGGRKHIDGTTRSRFLAAASSLPFPDDALRWADHLARVASPPGGRITAAVFSRLATETGLSERAVKRLVFGVPRRERHTS